MKKIYCMMAAITFTGIVFAQDNDEEERGKNSDPTVLTCGTERWAEKTLTDALASTVNYTPVVSTVTALRLITTPTPSSSMTRQTCETKTYRVVCNVTAKRSETDQDYHLVLSDGGTTTMIGEIPDPACSSGSAYINQFLAGRNWVDTYIGSVGGNNLSVNIGKVEVTGVAFVDPPHGQSGAAPNNLELHPILSIQFLSTTTGINDVHSKQLDVRITPNPFKESMTVNVISTAKSLNKCSMILYDVLANKVAEYDLPVTNNNGITATINCPELPSGIYIYRLINDGHPFYDGKLIKNGL